MERAFLVIFLLFFMPGIAGAQNNKTADKKFWTVNAFLVGSTIYDVESTYFTLNKCGTCQESNFFMKPFVNAGRPAIYAIQGSIDAGVVYASYKVKKGSGKFKKVWWFVPVAMTAGHFVAGTYNVRITIRF